MKNLKIFYVYMCCYIYTQETDNKSEDLAKLESQVEELQKKLAEEATAKKQITLLLLEDRKKMATLYLEEKKRSEDLNHLLREEKSKVSDFKREYNWYQCS